MSVSVSLYFNATTNLQYVFEKRTAPGRRCRGGTHFVTPRAYQVQADVTF